MTTISPASMDYRDERHALRQRADNLEHELTDAERRLRDAEAEVERHEAKDEKDEKELRALRKEVDKLKGRLGEKRPAKERHKKSVQLVLIGAIVAIVGTSMIAAMLLRSEPPTAQSPVAQTEPAVATAQIPAKPKRVAAKPAPARPPEPVFFGAEVIEQTGAKVAAGDACLLRAEIAGGLKVPSLVVRCGDHTLYDSDDPVGSGMMQLDRGALELTGSRDNTAVYLLRYVDTGQRTGSRNQIDVDSVKHRARVFSEGAERWSVTLHVRDVSFPRTKPALGEEPLYSSSFTRSVYAQAQLTKRSGKLPESLQRPRKDCELYIHGLPKSPQFNKDRFNCRVVLRCGGDILYGASTAGFAQCKGSGERPESLVDAGRTHDDGDPSLRFDWSKRMVEIEDGRDEASWSASFSLKEPAGCGWGKTWRGWGSDKQNRSHALSLKGSAKALEISWLPEGDATDSHAESAEKAATITGCDTAIVDLEPVAKDARRYYLVRGPGNKSLGGYWTTKLDEEGMPASSPAEPGKRTSGTVGLWRP